MAASNPIHPRPAAPSAHENHGALPPVDSGRPYGSRPDRPRWPLLLWATLYGLWFLFLLGLSLTTRPAR